MSVSKSEKQLGEIKHHTGNNMIGTGRERERDPSLQNPGGTELGKMVTTYSKAWLEEAFGSKPAEQRGFLIFKNLQMD